MGSAASWQIQSQQKALSGFLWFRVKFNPWRMIMEEGGVVYSPFVELRTMQGSFSPRKSWQILGPKQSWCISKPLSKRGQALWQVSFALRCSRADSQGPTEWASTGPTLINDANTALRSNAWVNRGDVSPSNRWQSPFSRAPWAARALGAGECRTIRVAQG